jgi:hypothetical protein
VYQYFRGNIIFLHVRFCFPHFTKESIPNHSYVFYEDIWHKIFSDPTPNVEVIEFFLWPNPSSRTMSLGLTESLKEKGTRNLPGVKGGLRISLIIWPPSVSRLTRKCGSLHLSHPYGPSWPVAGTDLPLPLPFTLNGLNVTPTSGVNLHAKQSKLRTK